MNIKNIQVYVSPKVKVVDVKPRAVVCESPVTVQGSFDQWKQEDL